MKKIISLIGMISLIYFSFIISEKTTVVVKETDQIMSKIKETKESYEEKPTDAIIENDTIIPGLYGKTVDVEKTYIEMKKTGTFNENYIIYDEVKPEISSNKQYDKYIISGNSEKNMVSLIFITRDNDDIDQIIKTLDSYNVKATFFVDGYWLEKNSELTINLINNNHTIGNLSYNMNYEDTGFVWMNNILKKIGKQKQNYCYITDNIKDLKACALQKNYTIKPSIIIEENPLTEIKQQIKPGSLIALEINDKTKNELELIITYIKSKGYNLENIKNHLSEKKN